MTATVGLISDRLRSAILTGDLEPGEYATQMSLAERLGVSRTPLREALRMLELEGLVLRESNGRFRISPLSIQTVVDLAVMRINVEALAVSLTVPRFGNADHARLEGCLAQIDRYAAVDDWVGLEAPHREFHQMIVSGAGERVTTLLAQLWDHASRYRSIAFQRAADSHEVWEITRTEHRGIVDAFEAYDAAAAAGWIVTQVARTALVVAERIDPTHPVTRVHDLVERFTGSPDLFRTDS
ncbi:GntR family transcriptional regulator [Pseudonocardia kujensis]|uniref:GntR family transcriptional regulator n=1 Tax=Pseudonocardia kujensis TaxID=1128675 RepID=UPI001E5B643A|nr:GntR family transcriptional regulator [Pseudonocardia kujensis]MCE0766883.1 GntR family transcriptional regulator [Pseudonocardia kujensis]